MLCIYVIKMWYITVLPSFICFKDTMRNMSERSYKISGRRWDNIVLVWDCLSSYLNCAAYFVFVELSETINNEQKVSLWKLSDSSTVKTKGSIEKMVCSIGNLLKRKCSTNNRHRTSKQFASREWYLIKLRSGVPELKCVCDRHATEYGKLYATTQRQCCNPLDLHTVVRRKSLNLISSRFHDDYNKHLPGIIEGRKICLQCRIAVKNMNFTQQCIPTGNFKIIRPHLFRH